jgi:hypothetical protein
VGLQQFAEVTLKRQFVVGKKRRLSSLPLRDTILRNEDQADYGLAAEPIEREKHFLTELLHFFAWRLLH